MGLGWLDAFMKICNGCEYDFIPVHWYANESAQNFEGYVTLGLDSRIWARLLLLTLGKRVLSCTKLSENAAAPFEF